MTLPDFQTLMRPLLEQLEGGAVIHRRQMTDLLADVFDLSEAERTVLLPSGKNRSFGNRVAWLTSHLFQAGLIARPRRGQVQITDTGRAALRDHPERIDMKVLQQYETYRAFRERSRPSSGADEIDVAEPGGARSADGPVPDVIAPVDVPASPQDLLERAKVENEADLKGELLGRALALSPTDFERLVVVLLERMGYGRSGAVEHSGQPGDAGIDAVVSQDPLGLDRIFVQAKRYALDHAVQRPAVQAFVGALMGAQGDRGVFITTSRYSEGARREAERVNARIELIDGHRLAALMLRHGVGVQEETTVTLHRVDEDLFDVL